MTALARCTGTIRSLLQDHTTLFDAAHASPGARPIAGRGISWVMPAPTGDWLIRHYRRGGAVASLLGDRYFGTVDRAAAELSVSVEARRRGIRTPEVVAAAAYGTGVFRRFDLAVVFIENSYDLAHALFERPSDDDAVTKAADLIRDFIGHGLLHADLNIKNIVIAPQAACIVDLDRCRLVPHVSPSQAERMRRRLARSVEKWQARTGTSVSQNHRRILEEAFRV